MNNPVTDIINAVRGTESRLSPILGDLTKGLVEIECNAVSSLLTKPETTSAGKQTQTQLLACTPQSWANVAFQAIQLGVTLNPHLKHAAVIPYGNNATLTVMIAGLKHLLFVNKVAQLLDIQCVRQNDTFNLQKPINAQTIAQNFIFKKSLQNRGSIIGAYTLIYLSNGFIHAEYLPLEEINKRRGVAKTQMVWDAWEGEMAEKTVLRYAIKDLPTFDKSALLSEIENQHLDLEIATAENKPLNVGKAAQLPGATEIPSEGKLNASFNMAADFEMEISDAWDLPSLEIIATKIKKAKNDGVLLETDRIKLLTTYISKNQAILEHQKQV